MDPFIFVHGHANDTHGNLSVFTQQRIDCADDLQQHRPNTIMIASGGTGHFNQTSTPHAHYIRDCWLEMGIARNRIVTFDTPQHTVDEIQCLKSWCLAHGSTSGWIISSDFHIDRIDFICQCSEGIQEVSAFGQAFVKGIFQHATVMHPTFGFLMQI